MIYLNAGIIDQYDNPKVDLECVVTKAYSQDILQNLAKFAMHLIDTPVTIEGHPVDLDIRNAIQLQHHESSSALKRYAGAVGLQHAWVKPDFKPIEFFLQIFDLPINFFHPFAESFRKACRQLQRFIMDKIRIKQYDNDRRFKNEILLGRLFASSAHGSCDRVRVFNTAVAIFIGDAVESIR